MISLIQAFKLVKIKDNEYIKLKFSNGKEIIHTSKVIRDKFDMKKIKVNHIQPWLSFYGEFDGWIMEVKQ